MARGSARLPSLLAQPGPDKATGSVNINNGTLWTGGNQTLLDRGGRVSRFTAKYGGFMKK